MNRKRDLLDLSNLLAIHPELHDNFYGDAAVLGDLIFAKRNELGWTQSELATKAQVDFKLITTIEGGSILQRDEVYENLYKVLSITKEERDKWIDDSAMKSPPGFE